MYATCNELNQVIVNIKQPLSGNLKNQIKINNGDGIESFFQN